MGMMILFGSRAFLTGIEFFDYRFQPFGSCLGSFCFRNPLNVFPLIDKRKAVEKITCILILPENCFKFFRYGNSPEFDISNA